MDECGNECSEEIRNMFTEQIQNMEQEQNRLAEIAQKTKQNKGIFGWIWK
jgi:flagellar motor component MotA